MEEVGTNTQQTSLVGQCQPCGTSLSSHPTWFGSSASCPATFRLWPMLVCQALVICIAYHPLGLMLFLQGSLQSGPFQLHPLTRPIQVDSQLRMASQLWMIHTLTTLQCSPFVAYFQ